MATLLEYLQMRYRVALDVDPDDDEPWCPAEPKPVPYAKAYRARKKAERAEMIAAGLIDAPLIEIREIQRKPRENLKHLTPEEKRERKLAYQRKYQSERYLQRRKPKTDSHAEPKKDIYLKNRLRDQGMLSIATLNLAPDLDAFLYNRIVTQIDGDRRGRRGYLGLGAGCFMRSKKI